MTKPTPAVELAVPERAADEWFVCGCSESGIRAGYKAEALPVIVAAELRRLAPLLSDRGTSADLLRDRADELDGGQR